MSRLKTLIRENKYLNKLRDILVHESEDSILLRCCFSSDWSIDSTQAQSKSMLALF